MAVTKKPQLPPLEASRSEMDLYAQRIGGLRSTGTNQGAATRNRVTPPTTQAPTPPGTPETPTTSTTSTTAGTTPAAPVVVAAVTDVGACRTGDRISFTVLGVKDGQVQLGDPLVLPGTPVQGT